MAKGGCAILLPIAGALLLLCAILLMALGFGEVAASWLPIMWILIALGCIGSYFAPPGGAKALSICLLCGGVIVFILSIAIGLLAILGSLLCAVATAISEGGGSYSTACEGKATDAACTYVLIGSTTVTGTCSASGFCTSSTSSTSFTDTCKTDTTAAVGTACTNSFCPAAKGCKCKCSLGCKAGVVGGTALRCSSVARRSLRACTTGELTTATTTAQTCTAACASTHPVATAGAAYATCAVQCSAALTAFNAGCNGGTAVIGNVTTTTTTTDTGSTTGPDCTALCGSSCNSAADGAKPECAACMACQSGGTENSSGQSGSTDAIPAACGSFCTKADGTECKEADATKPECTACMACMGVKINGGTDAAAKAAGDKDKESKSTSKTTTYPVGKENFCEHINMIKYTLYLALLAQVIGFCANGYVACCMKEPTEVVSASMARESMPTKM